MSYFRQPSNPKNRPKSIEGFVPRNNGSSVGTSKDIHQRFRATYRPEGSVGNGDSLSEGFTPRQQASSFQESPQQYIVNKAMTEEYTSTKKRSWREKRHNKKLNKKKIGKFKKTARAFAIFFAATIIGMGSIFGYGYLKARNIFKGDGEGAAALFDNVDPSKLNGEGDGRVNILLIGKGGPGHTAPDLTDTLLLASIDPIQNEAALVSVPRDLYVKDGNGYSTKINAIYSNAKQARLANSNSESRDEQAAEDIGLDALKDTVSEVLGVPVHYYVMIDFVAFEDAINTVGGITIDVQDALYDQTVAHLLGGNPLVAGEGLQTFDGKRALLYARSRKGSARGDFDRTERQREIIVALQKKVLSIGTFSNPFKVLDLLNNFGDRVRTDLNGLDEIKRLYEIGQQIGSDRIASVDLADPSNILVRTDNINGLSIVVPSEGLYQYDEIRSYIRNNLRDAFLKSEDARVIILNGTDVAGLATRTSEELRSYGYNVVSVDNAPTTDYVQNVLIDLTSGSKKYTKSYLEKRLGLVSTTQSPIGTPQTDTADFVIILGTDEISKTTN